MDAGHVPEVGQVRAAQGEEEEAQTRLRLRLAAEDQEARRLPAEHELRHSEACGAWRGGPAAVGLQLDQSGGHGHRTQLRSVLPGKTAQNTQTEEAGEQPVNAPPENPVFQKVTQVTNH